VAETANGCLVLHRAGTNRREAKTAVKTRVFMGNFGCRKPVNSTASTGFMERAMGIEPTSEAWEASNKTLKTLVLAALSRFGCALSWKMIGK
jgi:hypothetical protein